MEKPEIELRFGDVLLGGGFEPGQRRAHVLRNAGAAGVEPPDQQLRLRVAFCRGFQQRLRGLGRIALDPDAFEQEAAEQILRGGLALLRSLADPFGGARRIARRAAAFRNHDAEAMLRLRAAACGERLQDRDRGGKIVRPVRGFRVLHRFRTLRKCRRASEQQHNR